MATFKLLVRHIWLLDMYLSRTQWGLPWTGLPPYPRFSSSLKYLENKIWCTFPEPQGLRFKFPEGAEKAMAPHSGTLAQKISRTEEPGRLQSMGYRRVEHDWATSLSLFTFMHWRRKWQPTPVFLPGESQGWGSMVGCCLRGRTESDTTEAT